MKTSDDKWLEQIRKAVDGCEATPSDSLWDRIESDLPTAAPTGRRRMAIIWRAVAAAACLAIVAGAYFLVSRSDKPTGANAPVIASANQQQDDAAATTGPTNAVTASELVAQARIADGKAVTEPIAEPVTLISVDEEPECTTAPADTATNRIGTSHEFIEAVPAKNVDKHGNYGNYGNQQATVASTSKKSYRWHIALAADNDFGQSSSASAGGFAPLYRPVGYSTLSSAGVSTFDATYLKATSNNIDEQTSTDEIVSFPISYSATFRYMLTDRWGINAGLSYTSAASERRSGSASDYYSTKTRMHYVGVPVTVSYTFFSSRYVSLYALAGGSVEKCVKATRKDFVVASGHEMSQATRTETLDQRPWQGSLNAGAGVQFNITQRYGIFAEPQLVYDLSKDNATPAPRRNDFSFNLAVGIRMSY